VSVPSNTAEGAGKKLNKEFKHFLSLSLGSVFELETQGIIAHRLTLVDDIDISDIQFRISEIQKMIFALERSIVI